MIMRTLSQEAQEYALLTKKKREVQAILDNLNETLTRREQELLTRFGDEGCASVKVNTDEGTFNIFPRKELWAKAIPGHEQDLYTGLRATGYADLVRESVNTLKLSSLVREIDAAGAVIPSEWAGAVEVRETFKLSVRKANGK
jgi:hypothetical protein